MDAAAYLDRLGIDGSVAPTYEGARRLQQAHVTAVPFENLAIVGDPFDSAWEATGIDLQLSALFEKVVRRERGGFCFELNGLFTWLLRELGFDAERLAARMVGDDGTGRPPANHHTVAVDFDRRYLLDVGMGTPPMRRPLPIDGEVLTDRTGVSWRVVESERPDEQYLTQYRLPGDDWQDRYLFSDVPRELSYFQATCDYLASAPESPFTGGPVVSIGTADGYRKLRRDSLVTWEGEERERAVEPAEWHDLLVEKFGLRYG
ncbi:MAG: arylamine N-acetyltransferase [Halolamina sp.]